MRNHHLLKGEAGLEGKETSNKMNSNHGKTELACERWRDGEVGSTLASALRFFVGSELLSTN